MRRIALCLIGLAIFAGLLAGCARPAVDAEKYARTVSVTETTVTRLGDGLAIGLEWVSRERYTDSEGRQRTGLVARISVGNEALEQADTIEVYQGSIFQVGDRRFEVLRLKPNTSLSSMPGSSNGSIVIGELR